MTYPEWLRARTECLPKHNMRRTFKGERLYVWLVGDWGGTPEDVIKQIHPQLSVEDVVYARMYHKSTNEE